MVVVVIISYLIIIIALAYSTQKGLEMLAECYLSKQQYLGCHFPLTAMTKGRFLVMFMA